ncbi:MAG: tetratricopeptide repeat protein [Rubrivivax sp.]|nr:tetratricopeptide repeat protein [Rubrivivax sp.]
MNRLVYQWLKFSAMACLVLGQTRRAQEIFNQMLRNWPDDAYALGSRAHLSAQAGRLEAALADSQRLVALRADHAGTWFNHGFMLESAGRYEEALAAFRRATELGPKLDRAWYGMGLVLIRLQRYEEAVQALKRNTELQPMSPYGWYQLARVHVDRHQPEEAVKIIRHLKGFEPKVAAQLERETGLLPGRSAG